MLCWHHGTTSKARNCRCGQAGVRSGLHEKLAGAAAGTRYQFDYDALGNVARARVAPGNVAQLASQVFNGELTGASALCDWDSDGVEERYAEHTFTWSAGSVVLVRLSSASFDAALVVDGPAAGADDWIIDDNSGGGTDAYLVVHVDTAGQWKVWVTSPEVTTGSYTLEVLVNPYPFVPNCLVEFTYTHDELGNVQRSADNKNTVNEYDYDPLDRLQQARQSGTGVTAKRADFTYGNDSRPATTTRYSNLAGTTEVATSTYGYDDAGRLDGLVHTRGGVTFNDYGWTYDAAGRITEMASSDGTSALGYDASDQLTSADHSYQTDEGYSYDDNGNRTNTGYATSDANRMTSDGVYSYEYDAEGNRIRRTHNSTQATTRYEWDHRNRLTRVTEHPNANPATAATRIIAYAYDAGDRLVRRSLDSDGNGTAEAVAKYFYDGDDLSLELNGSDVLAHRYLWNRAVDEILADEQVGVRTVWGLADHEGTIRDLVDNGGTLVNHRKFDSFGRVTAETNGAIDFLFGFAEGMLDEATGLQRHGARWYDAAVGRWLSEDPISFGGGDANLYRYCGNSPANYVDPSGLWSWDAVDLMSALIPAIVSPFLGPALPILGPLGGLLGDGLVGVATQALGGGLVGTQIAAMFGWGGSGGGGGGASSTAGSAPTGPGSPSAPPVESVHSDWVGVATGWSGLAAQEAQLRVPEFSIPLGGAAGASFAGQATGAGWGMSSAARREMLASVPALDNFAIEIGPGAAAQVQGESRNAAGTPSSGGIGFWDWVQGGLDAGGVVEPTPFCDLASATISAFRGNWGDAGLSLAGMIPYIGDLGKVAKYGGKVAKAADAVDTVTDAARLADRASDLRKAGNVAPGVVYDAGRVPGPNPNNLRQRAVVSPTAGEGGVYLKPQGGRTKVGSTGDFQGRYGANSPGGIEVEIPQSRFGPAADDSAYRWTPRRQRRFDEEYLYRITPADVRYQAPKPVSPVDQTKWDEYRRIFGYGDLPADF
ncbi:MAG: hypothetical protein GXY83_10625 [Rhodopirellula sp.]|nr:hypothetical protein [Rhodopirellula sp.]